MRLICLLNLLLVAPRWYARWQDWRFARTLRKARERGVFAVKIPESK